MKGFDTLPTIFFLSAILLVVQVQPVVQGGTMYDKTLPERNRTTMYPTELYPGENVLTFYNPDGIAEITPMLDSLTASLTDIEIRDASADCSDSIVVRITVKTMSQSLNNRFMVTSCKKKRQVFTLRNCVWNIIDVFAFPDVQVGDTSCRTFRAGTGSSLDEEGEFIESITASAPQVFFRYHPDSIPPLYHSYEHVYFYDVCFVADMPGDYKFHVMHQIRRSQPAGGHTTFIVADTGVVRVLPREHTGLPSPGGKP